MNRNKLKTYAPQARRDFIQAVTDRASQYGLTVSKIEPMTEQGEVVLIAGLPFPKSVGVKRKKLDERIQKLGFEQTMEAMAYTWFNRLVAIRFMELHGYLEHGFRVLSHPEEHSQPEIVEHAQHVALPGLDQMKVVELKLDGTKEEELYRLLLIAQCNALHKALPFLFESINDEAELLLPNNLLHSDSLIRNLVNEIPEEDWREVEIIGWLYQFYISDKKDEVIGKVVASEDIPAATQLFTPNWIVKYLVQNTLGQQWMTTYPQSPLKGQMEYYIETAEQTPEVEEQLRAFTPSSLNPEELTLLDPACGSGHILVEAYDLFKTIYQERGYRVKDIPALILQKNLFGLEIDDRAAQLAAFALMMKARADDRRIFERDLQPHVLPLQESKGLNAGEITEALNQPILKEKQPPSGELFEEIADTKSPLFSKRMLGVKGNFSQSDLAQLLELFERGKTFGSLIHIPAALAEILPAIARRIEDVLSHGGMFEKALASTVKPLINQACLLARKYDAVIANPPYMGNKYYEPCLKTFVETHFEEAKGDLYACFIARSLESLTQAGRLAMITIPTWMFLAGFSQFRKTLLRSHQIDSFLHNGRGVFGADFGTCSFVIWKPIIDGFNGRFRRLFDRQGSVPTIEELRQRFFTSKTYLARQRDFGKISSTPIAYWLNEKAFAVFSNPALSNFVRSAGRCKTHGDQQYVRFHWEVARPQVGDGKRWKFYEKGGPFRKYYGNRVYLIDWSNDAREFYASKGGLSNPAAWGRRGVTWTDVTSSLNGFRLKESNAENASASPTILFEANTNPTALLGYLNSAVIQYYLRVLNPTIHVNVGDVLALPVPPLTGVDEARVESNTDSLVVLARNDWNSDEVSWEFLQSPLVTDAGRERPLSSCYSSWVHECHERIAHFRQCEESINTLVIAACGLAGEVNAEIADEQITLYRPNRENDIKRLLSYAIGCMMGRYSFDKPGVIYAHSGNQGFDPSQYTNFPADEDGIIPVTEFNWFADDASSRCEKFAATAWPVEHLEDNLKFMAESLGAKNGETPQATIRHYLAAGFYKHHLSMFNRRPIYWLFSSGKQRGFQALVYMHRYNEGTLARMRTEYVIPLLGKMTARIDHLTDDIAAASSSQHRKRLETEKATIVKQLAEVQAFEEKLRHCADQRIKLDLDDGVKINYGKFGDLLADVKMICGTNDED